MLLWHGWDRRGHLSLGFKMQLCKNVGLCRDLPGAVLVTAGPGSGWARVPSLCRRNKEQKQQRAWAEGLGMPARLCHRDSVRHRMTDGACCTGRADPPGTPSSTDQGRTRCRTTWFPSSAPPGSGTVLQEAPLEASAVRGTGLSHKPCPHRSTALTAHGGWSATAPERPHAGMPAGPGTA